MLAASAQRPLRTSVTRPRTRKPRPLDTSGPRGRTAFRDWTGVLWLHLELRLGLHQLHVSDPSGIGRSTSSLVSPSLLPAYHNSAHVSATTSYQSHILIHSGTRPIACGPRLVSPIFRIVPQLRGSLAVCLPSSSSSSGFPSPAEHSRQSSYNAATLTSVTDFPPTQPHIKQTHTRTHTTRPWFPVFVSVSCLPSLI